ncbi:MAG: AIPR family protein [Sulfurimonas sp.]|uniref:AIPR family protein n=1 Tax=Sulfurimonas sp. TaxID=2022749 RepID=UPI003D0D179A
MNSKIIKSYQDYVLIKTNVEKFVKDYGERYKFDEQSMGFLFFTLEKIFNLQEDEAYNAITDTRFIMKQKKYGEQFTHDKGVDAIVINEEEKVVHLMNFKFYTKDYEKIKDKHFESNEIAKVLLLLSDIFERTIPSNANPILSEKLKEIFLLQDKGNRFEFKIHFVSNIYNGFTDDEEKLLRESLIKGYKNDVTFEYILIQNFITKLIEKREFINAKFKVNGKNFFEKSEYGYRALIAEINAKDLIRIVSNNEDIRMKIDIEDEEIMKYAINENAFEDNVRVYLKQRSNINKNIKNTATSDEESSKFFFFNNGVTITCEKLSYQGKNSPVLELDGIQVVNGSQTIHSLKEAFDENAENFDEISLLCRIYETNDLGFKSKIAEYTNNQNPVNNRDVRSIDLIQIKLQEELSVKGYFYERKRNQFDGEDKNLRIDAEKFAQSFLSFRLQKPAEAKNKKSTIFSSEYDNIFNEYLTSDIVLKLFNLYNAIERKKFELKDEKSYLNHATYYIMYFISILKENEEDNLMNYYEKALKRIEYIREKEKEKLIDDYSDPILFKGNSPKKYLSELEKVDFND